MTSVGLDLCLALAVLATWLACLGFLRLRSELDRLHCVAFVNVTAVPMIAAAAFFEEGVTPRSVKLVALVIMTLLTGAAMSHAAGRALALRDGPRA
ncbi:MAG TPA: monovalent cation/H(+) antiporter subunit G [Lichenihabitans sp.]|jgi:multicomponent Na+:H+ antiporter subunit G|nr:monovalent cation/H(+) antiporter subunit G [Lichenihabitans sp.]